MVIDLDSNLEAALNAEASRRGTSVESLALAILRESLRSGNQPLPIPQDDWERRLLGLARDCGVSLSDEALSRETMYE
jgi:plasmid stability protein